MKKDSFLVLVQCRFNSSRLPGKAMLPLCGIPMLAFLLRRLRTSLPVENYLIILATTRKKEDDVVAAWSKEEGIEVLRGEESDVLKRYIQCLDRNPSDIVVRVTADNPLTCPETLKWIAQEMHKNNADYAICKNIPYGAGVDVFSSRLLKLLDKETKAPEERQHINLFVLRHKERFRTYFLEASGKIARPDLSMTIDTREDWLKINSLFKPNEFQPWRISLEEVIERLDSSAVQQSYS